MISVRKLIVVFAALFATLGYAAPASAQATRTWVSGVGDDANPCSRTAPCKTFAGAISKTATGGEINCLDPGGFGGVTIVKSISIICDYTEGGVLSAGAGVNGIVVNLPATTDTVFLSGIDFNGAGSAQNGLRVVSGGIVHLQNSTIRNYRASNGLGVSYQPAGAGRLYIRNTTITDNGTGATGGGILIQPTGAGGTARILLDNVRVNNNSNHGVRVDTNGNTSGSGVVMNITHSSLTGNGASGLALINPTSFAIVNVTNSTIFNNTGPGLSVNGAGGLIRASANVISLNSQAVSIGGGGSIRTYGDNIVEDNAVASSFGAPNLTKF